MFWQSSAVIPAHTPGTDGASRAPYLRVSLVAHSASDFAGAANRGLPQPLEIFLTRFAKHGWIETGRHGRLGVRIDVAQLTAEVHIQARVLARIVLASVCQEAILGPFADCHRYFYSTRMGVINPCPRHVLSPSPVVSYVCILAYRTGPCLREPYT